MAESGGKRISKMYFSMVNVKKIFDVMDESGWCGQYSCSDQEKLLELTINHPLSKTFPSSKKYRLYFLKMLMAKAEANGCDIADSVYTAYTDLLSDSSPNEESCFCSYFLDGLSNVITLEESTAFVSQATTGLKSWEAAKHLADWASKNKQLFKDRNIVELGCGIGLTGLAVCKLCNPCSYVFTDCHPEVLNRLKSNLDINVPGWREGRCGVHVRLLDWEATSQQELKQMGADVVLAADVVYEPSLIPPLVSVLHELLDHCVLKCEPMAFVACTIRNPHTIQAFLQELGRAALEYQLVEDICSDSKFEESSFVFDDSNCHVHLYKINKGS